MSLREKLEEEMLKGEEELRRSGEFPLSWLRFFGFESNPFNRAPLDPVKTPSDLEEFVDAESILKELAHLTGLMSGQRTKYHIGLIGVDGSGKRSIARAAYALATGRSYHSLLHSTFRNTVVYPEGYEPGSYPSPPDDDWVLVILEENRPTSAALSNLNGFRKNNVLLLSTWRPEEVDYRVRFDREIGLKPLTLSGVVKMIEHRISQAGGSKDDITLEAIESIGRKAKCIPGLCLKLAEISYDWAFRRKRKPIEKRDVIDSASRYGFDFPEKLNLSTKDLEVARFLLAERPPSRSRVVTVRDLSEALSMDRVLAWRYLERMRKKRILQKTYHGKAGHYELTESAAVMLQLELGPWRS
ncbi:MAG: hypothetical protein ACFFER_07715 [Candidatus Thorarchaeota archaeon]